MTKAQMLTITPAIGAFLQSKAVQGKDSTFRIGRYTFSLPAYNRTDLWVFSGKTTVNRINLAKKIAK